MPMNFSLSTIWSGYLVVLSFLANTKRKNAYFRWKKLSLTKFSTGLLCGCEQCGATDWKTLKTLKILRRHNLYEFLKNRIEKWLQILKIVRVVKVRPNMHPTPRTSLEQIIPAIIRYKASHKQVSTKMFEMNYFVNLVRQNPSWTWICGIYKMFSLIIVANTLKHQNLIDATLSSLANSQNSRWRPRW